MELETMVRLWRCSVCGKWSHATRRRVWHKRFIPHVLADEEGAESYADSERPPLPTGRSCYSGSAEALRLGLPVIEEAEPKWGTAVVTNVHGDPEPDEWYDPGGVTVRCGPFVEYVAILEAAPGRWQDDPVVMQHRAILRAEAMARTPVFVPDNGFVRDGDDPDVPF